MKKDGFHQVKKGFFTIGTYVRMWNASNIEIFKIISTQNLIFVNVNINTDGTIAGNTKDLYVHRFDFYIYLISDGRQRSSFEDVNFPHSKIVNISLKMAFLDLIMIFFSLFSFTKVYSKSHIANFQTCKN